MKSRKHKGYKIWVSNNVSITCYYGVLPNDKILLEV